MSDAAQLDNVVEDVCVALGFMPSEFSMEEILRAGQAIDAYTAEQTAALRAKLQRLSIDCLSQGCKRAEYEQRCVEADEDLERRMAALRAALNALLQPDVTRCASERCGECAACHARAVLASLEAAP